MYDFDMRLRQARQRFAASFVAAAAVVSLLHAKFILISQ